MKKPLSYEEFKAIYSKVPRLNVELFIVTDEGILLTKRTIDPYKDCWHVPGSTVYYGESFEDAVKRTAKTELGVSIQEMSLFGYIEYPSTNEMDVFTGWPMGVAFKVSLQPGSFVLNDEAGDYRYFTKIPENVIVDQRSLIEKALSKF